MDCIIQGICPQCGGRLRILNGIYGSFFDVKNIQDVNLLLDTKNVKLIKGLL